MLASLPQLVGRNFIIGFLLPTLLATLTLLGLFHDVSPFDAAGRELVRSANWEDATRFLLAVWVLSILLMLVNHIAYRVVEGYTGPFAFIGNASMTERRKELFARQKELEKIVADTTIPEPQRTDSERELDALDRQLPAHFPPEPYPALPTRFGNVIRAFESYSVVVYGADSIPTWNRLVAIVPKGHLSATADIRAEVDFFLNVFLLSVMLSALAGGRFVVCLTIAQSLCLSSCADGCWAYAAYLSALGIVAWLAYEGAVWRAIAWGESVKVAFDLYLPSLARALGYELPLTLEGRREFWQAFNSANLFFQPMDATQFRAASPQNASPEEQDDEDSDSAS